MVTEHYAIMARIDAIQKSKKNATSQTLQDGPAVESPPDAQSSTGANNVQLTTRYRNNDQARAHMGGTYGSGASESRDSRSAANPGAQPAAGEILSGAQNAGVAKEQKFEQELDLIAITAEGLAGVLHVPVTHDPKDLVPKKVLRLRVVDVQPERMNIAGSDGDLGEWKPSGDSKEYEQYNLVWN